MSRFDGWVVTDVRGSNKMGWYYSLNVAGRGGAGGDQRVRVKLSKHGKLVCLTCLRADACDHASFVSEVIKREGLPREVGS